EQGSTAREAVFGEDVAGGDAGDEHGQRPEARDERAVGERPPERYGVKHRRVGLEGQLARPPGRRDRAQLGGRLEAGDRHPVERKQREHRRDDEAGDRPGPTECPHRLTTSRRVPNTAPASTTSTSSMLSAIALAWPARPNWNAVRWMSKVSTFVAFDGPPWVNRYTGSKICTALITAIIPTKTRVRPSSGMVMLTVWRRRPAPSTRAAS